MAYQSECHMVKQEHSIFLIQGHLHRRMLFILCNKILKSQKFLKSEKIMSMFDKWVYVYLVNSRVSNKRPSSPACFFFQKIFQPPGLIRTTRLLIIKSYFARVTSKQEKILVKLESCC